MRKISVLQNEGVYNCYFLWKQTHRTRRRVSTPSLQFVGGKVCDIFISLRSSVSKEDLIALLRGQSDGRSTRFSQRDRVWLLKYYNNTN